MRAQSRNAEIVMKRMKGKRKILTADKSSFGNIRRGASGNLWHMFVGIISLIMHCDIS